MTETCKSETLTEILQETHSTTTQMATSRSPHRQPISRILETQEIDNKLFYSLITRRLMICKYVLRRVTWLVMHLSHFMKEMKQWKMWCQDESRWMKRRMWAAKRIARRIWISIGNSWTISIPHIRAITNPAKILKYLPSPTGKQAKGKIAATRVIETCTQALHGPNIIFRTKVPN